MAESKPVVVSKVGFPLNKREIRIEVGETSQGRDQLVISADQEAQTQSGLSREERFKMFKEENEIRISKTPKIQKAIFLLRDHKHFVKYYEPRVVSLGPIHHGREKYQLAEKFKRKLANEFVKSSGKTIEELCSEIEKNIKELRECFEEEVTKKYNDVDLAWILVVDGCAILQYIYIAAEGKFKELNIKQDSVAFCQQDLFLLENQVPYRLLELLMSSSLVGEGLRNSVQTFIRKNHHMVLWDKQQGENTNGPAPGNRQQEDGKGTPTVHLLNLLRSSLLGDNPPTTRLRHSRCWPRRLTQLSTLKSRLCTLLDSLWPSREAGSTAATGRDPKTSSGKPKNNVSDLQSYRNVQELKAAGIHVKRSEAKSLGGISFSRRLNFYPGFLSLPPLIVDDSTGPKLLNLIAYEMCLDFENDFGITSYVSFLDLLIDEANDVKELRKAHVLFNLLGSDEEVAQLFNEIGTDLVPDLDKYTKVMTQIQEYYDKTWVTWVAEFFHNHFSSPWTLLAFVGALFALALSATQTWYAVDSPPGPCDKFCEKFNKNL